MVRVIRALLPWLPERLAFRLTVVLASLAWRQPLDRRGRLELRSATLRRWGPRRRHVALCWGAGPLVILVHGWGGRALQMAPLARRLADAGFRVVAPDITGHGDSPGLRISFRRFVHDIADLVRELGEPVYALVGHSAGGLTMMAARQRGIRAERYVCLAAPRAPYPPVGTLRRLLAPSETVLRRCRDYFYAQFDEPPARLERGAAFRRLGDERLFLVYDSNDDQVEAADADLIAGGWPGAAVLRTERLGHHRVLWASEVHAAIAEFLSAGRPSRRPAPRAPIRTPTEIPA